MFGPKFVKVDPSTYLMKYRNGKLVKEGLGLSVLYFSPSVSLVSVPMGSDDYPFMFTELTQDFQEVSIQGQVTCKVVDVRSLTEMMNFTLNAQGGYVSDDPQKLPRRVINLVQVAVRKELTGMNLREAMASSEQISDTIRTELEQSVVLTKLGVKVIGFSIIAIKPNKETARALEAESREVILRQADDAVYLRRNAAIQQESIIKESELNTEIAVEVKRREIQDRKLETQRAAQDKKREMDEADMVGKIAIEKQNEELVALMAANAKREADAKVYSIEASMEVMRKTDPKTIQALALVGMDPSQLIATAFKDLSENASKIGQLNITPDLLSELMRAHHG